MGTEFGGRMDWDEHGDDSAGDDYNAEQIRCTVTDLVDEEAPALNPEARAVLIDSLTEQCQEGEHFTVEADGPYEPDDLPSPVFVPTQVGRELVRQQAAAFRVSWRCRVLRVPSVRARPRTACRPPGAARRVRRHATARTRGSPPSRSDDPEPEPPADRTFAAALKAVAL